MAKVFLSLTGKHNRGKSETLRLVCFELLHYGKLSSCDPSLDVCTTPEDEKDIIAAIEVFGGRVCIASSGDVPNIVKEQIGKLDRCNCDIIVMASRTKGGTVREIWNYVKKNEICLISTSTYQIEEIAGVCAVNSTQLNSRRAKEIVELVRSMLNG